MDYDVTLTTTNVPPTALLSHTGWVRGLARSLVRDAAAADDLTQETLLAALRGQPQGTGGLRPWLAGIARNLARQESRKNRLRSDREAEKALSVFAEEGGATQQPATPEATLARAEAHRSIVDHVLSMPEPGRALLLQRYFEGRRPAEIAAIQGVSPAAVHAGLTRAHGALREKLERDGGKEHWLATVGWLLLPISRTKGVGQAGVAAASAGAGGGLAGFWGSLWGAGWGVGSSVGAFLLVAAVAVGVSFLRQGDDQVRTRDQEVAAPEIATEHAVGPKEVAEVPRSDRETRDRSKPPAEEVPAEPEVALEEELPVVGSTSMALSGRCTDEAGRPMAMVEVALVRAVDGRPEFWGRSTAERLLERTITDANGDFTFSAVEPGWHVVGPEPKEGESTTWLWPVELVAGTPPETLEIQRMKPHWIKGRIELGSGHHPVRIALTAFRNDVAVQATTKSTIDGSFEFGPLAPGSYTVSSIGSQATPWAVPPTVVEATLRDQVGREQGTPLVVEACASRRLQGKVEFPTGYTSEDKAGTARIAKHLPEDETARPEWIAEVGVSGRGEYKAFGVEAGFYLVSYESLDGRHVALHPLVLHERDEHSSTDDPKYQELHDALDQMGDFDMNSPAEPAAVVWIHAGEAAAEGLWKVTRGLKKLGGIEVEEDAARLEYPVGPTGTLRLMVPLDGTDLDLHSADGQTVKRWTAAARHAGDVVVLER